jgi:low affinity Fe/Cu permease
MEQKDQSGRNELPQKLRFGDVARWTSNVLGSARSFMLALAIVFVWALTGPVFGYSDAWQLAINTGTTIVTFLMVFLIQNTQNRDARAIQLKLDELIRSGKAARNRLIDLEDCTDEELDKLQREFERLRQRGPRGPRAKRSKSRDERAPAAP